MSVAFHGTKITSSPSDDRDRGIGGVIPTENFTDAAGLAKLVADLGQIARDARRCRSSSRSIRRRPVTDQQRATILPGRWPRGDRRPERSVRTAARSRRAELRALA